MMSAALATESSSDWSTPHAGTWDVPAPSADVTLQLSAQTWRLLVDRPRDRELVRSVWDRLKELEYSGYDPGSIAALRFVLVHHQPTSSYRCQACRRWSWHRLWQRRPWPCVVWMQVHYELVGPLTGGGHHRRST